MAALRADLGRHGGRRVLWDGPKDGLARFFPPFFGGADWFQTKPQKGGQKNGHVFFGSRLVGS